MKAEQEQSIYLGLRKWRPENIDVILIKLIIKPPDSDFIEFQWTEQQFRNIIGELELAGAVEITTPLRKISLAPEEDGLCAEMLAAQRKAFDRFDVLEGENEK